jgi:hypothetical protein
MKENETFFVCSSMTTIACSIAGANQKLFLFLLMHLGRFFQVVPKDGIQRMVAIHYYIRQGQLQMMSGTKTSKMTQKYQTFDVRM